MHFTALRCGTRVRWVSVWTRLRHLGDDAIHSTARLWPGCDLFVLCFAFSLVWVNMWITKVTPQLFFFSANGKLGCGWDENTRNEVLCSVHSKKHREAAGRASAGGVPEHGRRQCAQRYLRHGHECDWWVATLFSKNSVQAVWTQHNMLPAVWQGDKRAQRASVWKKLELFWRELHNRWLVASVESLKSLLFLTSTQLAMSWRQVGFLFWSCDSNRVLSVDSHPFLVKITMFDDSHEIIFLFQHKPSKLQSFFCYLHRMVQNWRL